MGTITFSRENFSRRINMHRTGDGSADIERHTISDGVVTATALGTRKAAERLFGVHVYALSGNEAKAFTSTHQLGNGSWLN
jgi:hypothetical protein